MSTYAIIKLAKTSKVEVGQAVYALKNWTLKLVKKLHLTKLFLLVVRTLLSELHLFPGATAGTVENKENKRKLLLTSTNPCSKATVNKVCQLTLKLSSTQLTLNLENTWYKQRLWTSREDGELRVQNLGTLEAVNTALIVALKAFWLLILTLSTLLRNLVATNRTN